MFLNLETTLKIDKALIDSPNLCDRFTPTDLKAIGEHVWTGYTKDKLSRKKWEGRMEAALDLAMQVQKDKSFPWPQCSNVAFPLITIAALQFSARSYPNIIQGVDVVRYRVIGEDKNGEARKRADRISKHMSWQVLEEDSSWEEQHDRELINLSIIGSNFMKTYFSSKVGHNVSELVMAKDFVLDYWAKSVEDCARKTHVFPMYRNEIWSRCANKTFCDVRDEAWYKQAPPTPAQMPMGDNRKGVVAPQPDEITAFNMLEQHVHFDFDKDGYAEPYIVTIEESSKNVLRIVARFEEQDVKRDEYEDILSISAIEYFTKYSFIPAADGGVYDLGFGVFLGPISEAVSSGINQIIDSGTLQNSVGGFLGRGAKIRGGTYTMAPWEWKRVDSTGDDLRKNIVPFPERQVSTVMFQLIGLLINYADRISGTVDQMVGENPGQNTPAETSRNMTEQGMQVYSMIFKRVWRSMKEEFKKLYFLNRRYLLAQQNFGSDSDFIRREDYTGSPDQIAPVANPNITSSTMRMAQAGAVKQASMSTSGYDKDEVEINFLKALGVENISRIYPGSKVTGPLPNYHVQVAQIKLQETQLKERAKQMEWANRLMSERPLVQAQIEKLKAEVAQIIATIGMDKARLQLEGFELALKGLGQYEDDLNDRIKLHLEAAKGDKENGEGSDGGGLPGMAGASSDQGPAGLLTGPGAGANGAMGGGAVPGGAAA